MIIMANWKMNGGLKQRAEYFSSFKKLLKSEKEQRSFVFFPPAALAAPFSEEPFFWGVQNFHFKIKGAYTGENSLEIFKELGAQFCLLGHSERRYIFGESDSDIEKKFHLAQDLGFIPVLCVGEGTQERDKKDQLLKKQLGFLRTYEKYKNLPWNKNHRSKDFMEIPFIIAYEPLWAIGTGDTPSAEEVSETINFIKQFLSFQKALVVYGGSVNKENARALANQTTIDGFLVGGASLNPSEFYSIYQNAVIS